MAARAGRSAQRARDAGASGVHEETLEADPDGTGREVLRIEEGCHRVELFADLVGRRPLDLDAELRDANTERLLARD